MLICVVAADSAEAQMLMPKVGRRYITVGLVAVPVVLLDDDDAFGLGATARLGVQQALVDTFIMGAELNLGALWLDDHSAAPDGAAEAEVAFAWSVGLHGRWLPMGDVSGLSLGGGVHYGSILLSEASMQMLGLDLRVGWYTWSADQSTFWSFELGYTLPVIAGLNTPTDFTGQAPAPVDATWSLQQLTLGVSFGF